MICIPSKARELCREEFGSDLIEFALSAVVLFTVFFGIMDCSRALYADHYVAYMASEASRYASVRGSTWQGTSCATTTTFSCMAATADVASFVSSVTPLGFQASNLTVTTTWTGNTPGGTPCGTTNGLNSPGCLVQVVVKYSFNFILPFLPTGALVLTSTSAVAISK